MGQEIRYGCSFIRNAPITAYQLLPQGPIYSLSLAGNEVVVINSSEIAIDLLGKYTHCVPLKSCFSRNVFADLSQNVGRVNTARVLAGL